MSDPEEDEQQWIRQAQQGDRAAFSHLVRRYQYPIGWVIGYSYNGGHKKPWPGEPSPQWVSPRKFTDGPMLTLACDLNAWAEGAWVIATHCNGGAAKQDSVPFLWINNTITSRQAGAQGGNVLLLSGSVHWKNIKQMTSYWAYQAGGYWNAW